MNCVFTRTRVDSIPFRLFNEESNSTKNCVRKVMEMFCSEFSCIFGGIDWDPENEGFGVWIWIMMKKFKIVRFLKGFLRKGLWTKKVPTNVKKTHGKYQGYWDTIGIVMKEIRLYVENLIPQISLEEVLSHFVKNGIQHVKKWKCKNFQIVCGKSS